MARELELSELLYAECVVLMSDSFDGWLMNNFVQWKEPFECKSLKLIFIKTRVVVSGGMSKERLSTINVCPCAKCNSKVKTNSILCV